MTAQNLRDSFERETGIPWINSQEEPDLDYVMWLEQKVLFADKEARVKPYNWNDNHLNSTDDHYPDQKI